MNFNGPAIPLPGESFDEEAWIDSALAPEIEQMRQTPQNPEWHAEGDVWTHTKLIIQHLLESDEWQLSEPDNRTILFLAALLHDIGKTVCTRTEEGRITSPNHGKIGAKIARKILWQRFELAGTVKTQQIREAVCSLIRFHSTPVHFLNNEFPEFLVLRAASDGETARGMTNRLLATLAEADVTGRIAENIDSSRELIELYRQSAAENNSLDGPFSFASPRSRYAYFNGRLDSPHAELFDDSWGEVVILSGLPGTGKDTFARKYLSDRPIVSLDTIREELKIPPDANQDAVAAAARERAKELLRAKQPFVWNATNVTEFLRAPIVRLCVDYGASVRLVFLEASWEETLRRNKNRSKAVPESVLDRLLTKLEPPTVREAHQAEWHV